MPLDTRLPLLVRQAQPITPEQAAQTGFALRQAKRGEDQAIEAQRDQKTIQDLYRQNVSPDGSLNATGFDTGVAQAGLGDKLPGIQKARLDASKTQVDTQASQFKLAKERADAVSGGLASLLANPNVTHQDVYAKLKDLTDAGVITPDQGATAARGLPGKPEQLRPFLVQQALQAADASKRLEALLPKYDEQDRGGTINQGTIDPLTGTRTAGTTTITKTATPGEVAASARANAKDNPELSGADLKLVDMIGSYRMVPSARLQSTPKGQALLAAVEAKYPGYDVTTAEAKVKAARDFGTGKEGAALRSIGTANKHLDMLGGIVDALNNGDTQLVNRIANSFAAQTGSEAPNTFDAVKHIVGQEVVKAIVAGGGGVTERQEAGNALQNSNSPAQLRDVIAKYRGIMGAQRESLLQQRRALGLSDNTLPDYTEGANGGPAPATDVPPDIASILKKHGSK